MIVSSNEQAEEYYHLVQEYINVLVGNTKIKDVDIVHTLIKQYCEKYKYTFNEVSRDMHLAAIMTIALQDKK